MSFTNMILIGVALFAILGAIGAFTIAYRRVRAEQVDATAGVSEETRRADRSMAGVRVEPVAVAVEEPAEPEPGDGAVEVEVAERPVAVQVVERQRVVEVTPEESGVTRRQFFNRALNSMFFVYVGVLSMSSLAFFWPRITGGFGADIDAGTVGDLRAQGTAADGSVVPVFIPEARAYVVPAPAQLSDQFEGKDVAAGGLMALFQRCVHLGCRVPWCATSVGFECPCHGSKYNYVGEYFAGPAPRNLDRFVVAIVDDRFVIKTGTIIETPRAPRKSVAYPQGPSCISL
jgi:cytochrome b6-f complex iron-sulfur subunit